MKCSPIYECPRLCDRRFFPFASTQIQNRLRPVALLSLALSFSFAAYGQRHAPVVGPRPVSRLHVGANGRYFQTSDGRPWLWLGDTGWTLLTDYTPTEATTYLAARAEMGFTLVQMVAVWDGGTGTEHGPKPNSNMAGVQPWFHQDPLQPNEAYWKNVDRVIATAAKDGLYVGLLPAWGSFVVNYKMITMANAEAYGRWLGNRYRNASNLVWIVGGDREFTSAPDIWRAIGLGLQQGDGGAHLIVFHPGGKLVNTQQERWLSADMIQTWAWYKDIPKQVATDYALKPTKPVILGEGAYEDGPEYPTGPITPLIVRKQAYWTYLSGGFFTYGHNDMWRKNPTWKKSLRSEGAQDMRILHHVFDALPWWDLVPAQSLFAMGQGSGTTFNAAAVSSNKTWAMVYLSSPTTVELQLDRLKGRKLNATWISPTTGHLICKTAYFAGGVKRFTTPVGWPDAILLLQRNTPEVEKAAH